MKKCYLLPSLQAACFILISLFLQSCGAPTNLPIQGEEGPVETIEQEDEQGISSYDIFPSEIWQYIFSYLDFEGVLSARVVNSDWNELITGYREAAIVGITSNPHHIIDARSWVKREEIDFINNKLKELMPAAIPSFAFYHLMGHVNNLPQRFWLYLPATQVHTLDLRWNQTGAAGATELAKALPATRVHTLDLSYNQIGAAGAREFAKALPGTQMHTLHLRRNQIGDAGASELAKALPNTQVHTLDLSWNEIGDAGARELAKALPATPVHTLDLIGNGIGEATQQLLKKQYPHIKCWF
jgi:hypothetical protein